MREFQTRTNNCEKKITQKEKEMEPANDFPL